MKENLEPYSDQNLVKEYLKKGDEKSLEFLVKKYLKPIFNFAYRYSLSTQEAEDITQETFIKAWKNLKKFDAEKNFKTWLFSIAKNTAIDFLRQKKTVPFSAFENKDNENSLTDNLADPAPLPPEIFEQKDLSLKLAAATEKLDEKHRLILLLRYTEHFTFREIAEILQEPLDTVKSRHRRGLIALKEILTEENGQNAPKDASCSY